MKSNKLNRAKRIDDDSQQFSTESEGGNYDVITAV